MTNLKKVTGILLSPIVILILILIFYIGLNSHKFDWNTTSKKYYWIFKDSVIGDIDSNFNFSLVKERDIFNHFIYKGHYLITIWEFKDLSNIDLNQATITSGKIIPDLDISFGKGCIFDPRGNPETILHYYFNAILYEQK